MGVAPLAWGQTGSLRVPRAACSICSWDPEPPRGRGSPLPPFPASSGPRGEGPPWAWGWVLGGKERPAAASALPALLCQPGGDLLGGPESFEGSVRVGLLLPGPHLGVCSLRLLGPRPSLTKPQPSCTRTFSPPLPTPPLPPSTPRVCVCGFIYLPAPRMGAGAPRLPAKGAGRWLGRWLRAPGSGRPPPHARTKTSRAWACNLEMGQVAPRGGGGEERGRDAAETPFLLLSPPLRHCESLRVSRGIKQIHRNQGRTPARSAPASSSHCPASWVLGLSCL